VLLESSLHPGRRLRLAYCLNLHAAEDLAGTLEGMRRITLPLRDRLAPCGRFGVGLYLPARVAFALVDPHAGADLETLASFLAAERLDPFTFNAFPFGDFHSAGLKRGVFAPTWCEPERLRYTLAVAEIAARLNPAGAGHVSISTHPGRFGPWAAGEFECAAQHFRLCLLALVEHAAGGGPLLRLALEAEPRAVAGDSQACADLLERLHTVLAAELGRELVERHLGACLDACHSAVEFEDAPRAAALATRTPLGKLQYSSAISLRDPGRHGAAQRALLALDEPRYLHQTTGRRGAELLRVDDLPDLARACQQAGWSWLACDEWRTHFHVPVDLERLGDSGLATTREHAATLLRALVDAPERWGGDELHVEIETYTWDILPGSARGDGDLIAGLAREYAHLLDVLAERGWAVPPEAH
jgi:hypothetical protein